MLRVTCVEITNFKLMDSGKSSDPYCKITTGGDYEVPVRTTVKPKQVGRCVWEETFNVKVGGRFLTIDVMDKDRIGSDDVMGKLEVPISHFADQQPHDEWYRLSGGGEIHLRVQLTDPQRPPAAPTPFPTIQGPTGSGSTGGGYGQQSISTYPSTSQPAPQYPPAQSSAYPPTSQPGGYPPQQQTGYPPTGYPPQQPQYPPTSQPGYPPTGYPPTSQPSYPPQQPTYPPQQPQYPPTSQPGGYPPQQPQYPPPQAPGYGYPPQQPQYPPQPQPGYPGAYPPQQPMGGYPGGYPQPGAGMGGMGGMMGGMGGMMDRMMAMQQRQQEMVSAMMAGPYVLSGAKWNRRAQKSLDELAYEAHLSREQVQNLKAHFEYADRDRSGTMSRTELISLWRTAFQAEADPQLLDLMFQIFDRDHSGQLTFNEFVIGFGQFNRELNAFRQHGIPVTAYYPLRRQFMKCDRDGSGQLSLREMRQFLALDMSFNEMQLRQLFREIDKDGSGSVSFYELTPLLANLVRMNSGYLNTWSMF